MPAVLIYHQKNLEYIVLPSRRILAKGKALIGTIRDVERHPFWSDSEERKAFYEKGAQFFKLHENYLGSLLSMDDANGKMSSGFFLYLTFNRFQNQQYQAVMVNKSDLIKVVHTQKLEKNNIQKSDETFAKLLTLETALEYLVKANPGEKLEYIKDESKLPKNTRLVSDKLSNPVLGHSIVL